MFVLPLASGIKHKYKNHYGDFGLIVLHIDLMLISFSCLQAL